MPFWRLESEPLKQLINDKLDSKPQFVEQAFGVGRG